MPFVSELDHPLQTLFSELRPVLMPPTTASDWTADLAEFIGNLRVLELDAPLAREETQDQLPLGALADFLTNLARPIAAWRPVPNPWAKAHLRNDEVRNSAILAWFLDPKGDHRLGGQLLRHLLGRLQLQGLPADYSDRCRVTVEECPSGERDDRVDILIDDPGKDGTPGFLIIVEVKIDAFEQADQILRYCNQARARTGGARPWAIVFLTRHGGAPITAGDNIAKVLPLSWGEIADALHSPSPNLSGSIPATPDEAAIIARFLASSFAGHVRHFSRK